MDRQKEERVDVLLCGVLDWLFKQIFPFWYRLPVIRLIYLLQLLLLDLNILWLLDRSSCFLACGSGLPFIVSFLIFIHDIQLVAIHIFLLIVVIADTYEIIRIGAQPKIHGQILHRYLSARLALDSRVDPGVSIADSRQGYNLSHGIF